MKKCHLSMGLTIFIATTLPSYASLESSTYHWADIATIKPNATIQMWTIGNMNSTINNQNVRLRRAEIKASGSVVNSKKYTVMIDPARLIPPSGGKNIPAKMILQDFSLSAEVVPGIEISVGQMKAPMTAEGLDSSSSLILPERSLVGRILGDRREMGLKVSYKKGIFNTTSMISSGRAIYNTGMGMFNDFHTRVELSPIKNLSYGTFVTIGNGFNYSKKGRWGLNARYNFGDTMLRAEYAQGRDGGIESQGLTTEVGYWITPSLQPVVRYERFSPNQVATTQTSLAQAETIGVNYLLPEYNSKVQVSGSALQNLADPTGTPTLSRGVHNAEVTVSLQASI